MRGMLTNDVLEMCRDYDRDMQELKSQRSLYMDAAASVGSEPRVGGGGSGKSDPTMRWAMKLKQVDDMIALRREMHDAELDAVCQLIDRLGGLQARIMHRYYVGGDTQCGIARRLNYSEEHIRQQRKKALDRLPTDVPSGLLPADYAKKYKRYQTYALKNYG